MNVFDWLKRNKDVSHSPARVEALLVEDQDDVAMIFEGLLRQHRVITTRTNSIAQTLEVLQKQVPYHLAFVDLSLPDGSGIEIVRRIREGRSMTHVIVLSGDIGKIPLAASYGYIGVLEKPFSPSSVEEILRKHNLPRS